MRYQFIVRGLVSDTLMTAFPGVLPLPVSDRRLVAVRPSAGRVRRDDCARPLARLGPDLRGDATAARLIRHAISVSGVTVCTGPCVARSH
jgi:hypothetical protein